MKERDENILGKILDEIAMLEAYTAKLTRDEFMKDEIVKRATAMTLINIGELTNHLSKEFQKEYAKIPYRKIVDLRNVAAHGYHQLHFNFIWDTIKTDVPQLREAINKIKP